MHHLNRPGAWISHRALRGNVHRSLNCCRILLLSHAFATDHTSPLAILGAVRFNTADWPLWLWPAGRVAPVAAAFQPSLRRVSAPALVVLANDHCRADAQVERTLPLPSKNARGYYPVQADAPEERRCEARTVVVWLASTFTARTTSVRVTVTLPSSSSTRTSCELRTDVAAMARSTSTVCKSSSW